MTSDELYNRFSDHTLLTREKFRVLCECVQRTKLLPGDIAELGVFLGGVSAAMALECPTKTVYCFDTFSGLPFTEYPEHHKAGEFPSSESRVRSVFESTNFKLCVGRFPETAECDSFSFVHVDGDYYESTRDAIEYFWPRMVKGGIILFDDYKWPHCPGVERALAESKLPIHELHFQAYSIK